MKKVIAIILIVATLSVLCAMPVGAAKFVDPLAMEFDATAGTCDMFYETIEWYVVCQLSWTFVEWNYDGEPPKVEVPAEEYEAEAAKYCVLSDELLQAIRSETDYEGNPIYDPETDTYTAFFVGGWGGMLPARVYAGYVKTGEDTYDVYYEAVTYEYLDDVLPEGMTIVDLLYEIFGENWDETWPDTIDYGGHIYQNGPEGYYRLKSYDKHGIKYACKVENGNALLMSRTPYAVGEQPEKFDDVTVEPTVITKQPAKAYVKAGATAKFTVKATGTGLKYQWQSSADGENWKNCSSSKATSATFTFTAKTSHSSNYYRCKITNAAGEVTYSKAARLYVLGVTSQPKTQKVEAGEKVKFTVAATGAGKTYQWQSSTNGKTWKNCSSSSATSATFTFTGKISHDENYYRCRITDSKGNVVYTDKVRLYVLGVEEQPENERVTKGKTAEFEVDATGHGLKYQWQCSTNGGKTWKNCTSSSAKDDTFTFKTRATHNGNYYRCRITDSKGNVVYTIKVKLTVK